MRVQMFLLSSPGAVEQWMLMLFSGMAGISEIFRNSAFILITCSLLLSKAHGGIEEENE